MRRILAASVMIAATTIPTATAHASAPSFGGELGGDWDGQYCRTSVTSERNAVRDIKVAVPDDLVDNPTTAPVIRDYLHSTAARPGNLPLRRRPLDPRQSLLRGVRLGR